MIDSLRRWTPVAFPMTALVWIAGCGDSGPPAAGAGPGMNASMPSVEVVQARVGSLPLEERLTGTVRARNQVVIYPEISAPVERVAAQNGDFVEAGRPLVYLRDRQYQDQLTQVRAALTVAEADARRTRATLDEMTGRLERMKQLVERDLESPQQLETLQAQVTGADAAHAQALARIEQAEANVQEQEEMLRRTVIRAPISGNVGQRNVEVGMRVDPNTALYTIGNFDVVRVDVSITDEMMSQIEVGQTALIASTERPEDLITAEVSRISPFLEAGNFSAAAEIDVSNADRRLRPGMFVTVDVLYGESETAVLIPEAAIFDNPTSGVTGVFVAPSLSSETPVEEPDEFDPEAPPPMTEATPMEFRPVDVLARGRGVAGVSGISMGDWVVTVGQNLLATRVGDIAARARPVPWTRVAELQVLQDQDLLRQFMDKQQRMADSVFSDESPSGSSGTAGE